MATAVCLGAGATAHAAGATPCPQAFHVAPGVGSTFVSRIQVSDVTCAKAQFAIGRYEHSLRHTRPFTLGGLRFSCTRRAIAPRSDGVTLIACRHASQRVGWHSAYGI
jgi:hypothetical protein